MAANTELNASVAEELVIPVRLSLEGTWSFLSSQLRDTGIDISIIIMELLRSVFHVEGIYGKHTGAYGAYLIMRPERSPMTDEQADVFLHEALQLLCDEIAAVIPNLQVDGRQCQYHYPNGPHVIFYLPVDASVIGEQNRSKLIPKNAVHHLVR
jgi:hypothetical protein